MGKSLNGKELGRGITHRKDGIYQGRFVNRSGKKQTIYASTLNEVRQKLRNAQYEDEKALNVVTKDITLDGWYKVWMDTCKKNCRASTKEEERERRVLTVKDEEMFLKQAEGSFYYNLYVVALDTGLRVGELMGLTWNDVNLKKKVLHVRHTLRYFRKDGKYIYEMHDTKTKNSRRTIPLTQRVYDALK